MQSICEKIDGLCLWQTFCKGIDKEEIMLHVSTENIGDMAVIECEGKIAHSEVSALRDAVIAQDQARVLVLDFSEVNALEGSALGMLVSLQYWAQQHGIQLKVFNPSYSVRYRLERASSMHEFEIASLPEVMGLLIQAENQMTRETTSSSVAAA
jgi:anti-anti-sigma factor